MPSNLIPQIPNVLTTLRLCLAVPIYVLILERQFATVLWIALLAGLSDGLDGWLARKLNAMSRYGAIVDPLSDKAMLLCAFIAFVQIELLPMAAVATMLLRDAIILLGAGLFYLCFGQYQLAPSRWGKSCTFAQIILVLLIIAQQLIPQLPDTLITTGLLIVLLLVVTSGLHYIYTWGRKAMLLHKKQHPLQ